MEMANTKFQTLKKVGILSLLLICIMLLSIGAFLALNTEATAYAAAETGVYGFYILNHSDSTGYYLKVNMVVSLTNTGYYTGSSLTVTFALHSHGGPTWDMGMRSASPLELINCATGEVQSTISVYFWYDTGQGEFKPTNGYSLTNSFNVSGLSGRYKIHLQGEGYRAANLSYTSFDVSTPEFYIDNDSPSISSSVANGNYTNSNFTMAVNDGAACYLSYLEPNANQWTSGSDWANSKEVEIIDPKEGTWKFRAIDKAGRKTDDYIIYVDKTKPQIQATTSGHLDNGFTKDKSVQITVTEANPVNTYYKMPGDSAWQNANSKQYNLNFKTQGEYQFYAVDSAGNESEILSVYYDNEAPRLDDVFVDGAFYNTEQTFVYDTSKLLLNDKDEITVLYDFNRESASFPEKGRNHCHSGITLAVPGNFTIELIDRSLNSTIYHFTIDKTAPSLSLSGVTNNGFTNGSVSVSWSTVIGAAGSQRVNENDVLTVRYAMSDTDKFPETVTQIYTAETQLNKEGNYLFEIQDSSKNVSSYRFTIDKTKPTLTLSGVAKGGFTNGDVSASWLTTVGKVKTQLVNSNDALTVKYSRSENSSFPTAVDTVYTAGTSLSEEGNYRLEISDKSNNANVYTFTIDKTAPTLTLSGVSNNGFTNGNVSASWVTIAGNVKSQLVNSNDTVTVKYDLSTTAAFPSSANKEYGSGTQLSEEGNYLIEIKDRSNNVSSYRFTIDKTAPTLTLSGVSNGGFTKTDVSASWKTNEDGYGIGKQLSNSNDGLTVSYAVETSKYEYPTVATTPYNRNSLFVSDCYCILTISDAAQNVTTYRFVIDKTAPKAVIPDEYTNKVFTYSASDPHGVKIEYRLNNGAVSCVLQSTLQIAAEEQNFGSWEFRAIDDVGNATVWSSVKFFMRDTFGNSEQIKNDFKVPTWFTVRLPKRIYTDIADTYSFADYETALNFSIAKEWEYRVETLSGGKWSYVNVTNESVSQIYEDRAVLDSAVLKYAKGYISDRYTFGVYGNDVKNPTDSDFVSRPDALTLQTLEMPGLLAAYSNLPLYFINHRYQFSVPDIGVPGNTRYATVKFISDGFRLQSGEDITVIYGEELKTVLEGAGAWKFGYYLITESDLCGNSESYVVCLDTMLPELTADIIEGNGNSATLTFDSAYTITHSGVMLYASFNIKSLYDSLDSNVAVMLEGRGFNSTIYTVGDEFPNLCYENGNWGTYTVTVYDRSRNAFSFSIKIAGEPMSVRHSSLTSDTRCTLTIVNDDSGNAMTDVELYKITYTGEYVKLDSDDDGTEVAIENFVYVLRTGGKYVLRITDIFGRVIETEPMFFLKGLPTGLLRGVKDGGITNKDVTFEYASDTTVILYTWQSGRWEEANDFMTVTEKEGYNIAAVAAGESSSRLFKFFLYLSSDRNLFVEYRFEIDCIAPVLEVFASDGEKLTFETVTQKDFRTTWDESNLIVYYYRSDDALGSLGEKKYTKDTVLSVAGNYVFTAYDTVKNTTVCRMTLDNVVSYRIEGNYSRLKDGSLITKNGITFTVNERTAIFECENTNAISVQNGHKLTIDGSYNYRIEDMYGNRLELTVIVDNLPPTPSIKTIDDLNVVPNGTTNKPFVVSCDEEEVSVMIMNGARYEAYDGEFRSAEGKYTFKMTDRMNNILTFTVTVDLTVNVLLRGNYVEKNGIFISRGGLSISANEPIMSFSVQSENGNMFGIEDRITAEDSYTATITDAIGNIRVLSIVIDQTPPSPIIESVAGDDVSPNGKINKPFVVSCAEEDSVILWSKKGGTYSAYLGQPIEEIGEYSFKISDLVKNEFEFTVEYDVTVSYSVSGTYVRNSEGHYISRTGLTVTMNEEYSRFSVASNCGHTFALGEKVVVEGEYIVTIEDAGGNVITITLVMDLTAPTPLVFDADGNTVEKNSIVKSGVEVRCEEPGATIERSKNGKDFMPYDGVLIKEPGKTYFRVSDMIGNSTVFEITVDSNVDFSVNGKYVIDYLGRYVSNTGLSVTVDEEYSRFSVASNCGHAFAPGEKVVVEGEYIVTIEDVGSNVVTISLVIDFTAPTPKIVSESGKSIDENTTINESFTVTVEERGATIEFSSDGNHYSIYDGAVLSAEKKYTFRVYDIVENLTTFTVIVDKSVAFKIKGTHEVFEGNYYTRFGVTVEPEEELKIFEVTSNGDNSFALGDKVTKEDTYAVKMADMFGNELTVKIIVDYTAPEIDLIGVNENNAAKDAVTVIVKDYKRISCRRAGQDNTLELSAQTVFEEVGDYTITATDYAGNVSSVVFKIDKSVDVTSDVQFVTPGQFVTGVVRFTFNEKMDDVQLVKDGVSIGYNGGVVSEVGNYMLIVTDKVGNVAEWNWEILPATAREYRLSLPQGFNVSATKDGAATNVMGSEELLLDKDGEYVLRFANGDVEYSVILHIDTVPPTVQIDQLRDNVVISSVSKANVKLTLYCDGKAVDYSIGQKITTTGDYRLVVTDEFGNVAEYSFSLHYINGFGIAVIVIGVALALALIVVVVLSRLRQKIK